MSPVPWYAEHSHVICGFFSRHVCQGLISYLTHNGTSAPGFTIVLKSGSRRSPPRTSQWPVSVMVAVWVAVKVIEVVGEGDDVEVGVPVGVGVVVHVRLVVFVLLGVTVAVAVVVRVRVAERLLVSV